MFIKVNFLLREIFRGNLNEAISLIEIEVTFKVISISAIEITLAEELFISKKKQSLFSAEPM